MSLRLARSARGEHRHVTKVANRRLHLTRAQVLAFRRRVGVLDQRLPAGSRSLRVAAWAGLQDSMPRAALLSIHARVEGTEPGTWEDPSFVQVWGPRFSAYVVAEPDRALFTVARLPDDAAAHREWHELADRIEGFLEGRRMDCREVGRGLGRHPVSLRYAAPTGRVLMRWDGARQPTIWTVPRPEVEPADARLELARRYLHVFGPTTSDTFAEWAGIKPARGRETFDSLARSLTPVRTPAGEGWILSDDEKAFRSPVDGRAAPARLLPSGDTYFLLQGADRELLVRDAARRGELWTPRVWPGAVVVAGEVAGTWRRAGAVVTVQSWRRLSREAREAVELEAQSFPLPALHGQLRVRWET
jgi:DNA glycosylase AlkZ-like